MEQIKTPQTLEIKEEKVFATTKDWSSRLVYLQNFLDKSDFYSLY